MLGRGSNVLVDEHGVERTVDRDWFAFGYDESALRHPDAVVLEATLALAPADPAVLRERVEANLAWRGERHPARAAERSAGCRRARADRDRRRAGRAALGSPARARARPRRRPADGSARSAMSTGRAVVSICGEVDRPVDLHRDELAALADGELVADFHCREGWSRLGLRWRGIRLATLLSAARARERGRFVLVGSDGYTALLEGPRLVGPADWDCFLSVKSVDRTAPPGGGVAGALLGSVIAGRRASGPRCRGCPRGRRAGTRAGRSGCGRRTG
ncbi:MAG TPA: molybdopterin-dependent oxidoreductase [Gaiellaceae bacterium]|nr:molybdopterin-dependent oxidoreductase [Gaiellaceae bacterium]